MNLDSLTYLVISAVCTWYPLGLMFFGGSRSPDQANSLRQRHYRHAAVSTVFAHVFMGAFLFSQAQSSMSTPRVSGTIKVAIEPVTLNMPAPPRVMDTVPVRRATHDELATNPYIDQEAMLLLKERAAALIVKYNRRASVTSANTVK